MEIRRGAGCPRSLLVPSFSLVAVVAVPFAIHDVSLHEFSRARRDSSMASHRLQDGLTSQRL